MLIGGLMVDKQKMTEFFTEKLRKADIPEDIQQAILREIASLEGDPQTRIFAALHLYQQALTPLEKTRAATKLYFEGGLQHVLLIKLCLQDPVISKILSVFSGEKVLSQSQ